MSNRLLYKSVAGPDLANSVSNYLQANKALASGFTGLGDVAATLDKNRADAANAALLRGLIKQESFADAQNYLNAAGTQQDLAYATAAYLDKAMNYKQGMPEVDKQVFNNRINTEYAQNGDLVSKAFQAYSRGDVASYNAQLEEARRRGLSSQVIDKIKYEVETNRGRRITNDTNAYDLQRKQRYDRITDIATPHVNHILAQRARGLVIDPQKYYDEHRDELQQLSFKDFKDFLDNSKTALTDNFTADRTRLKEQATATVIDAMAPHKTADAKREVLDEQLALTQDPELRAVLIDAWEKQTGLNYYNTASIKLPKESEKASSYLAEADKQIKSPELVEEQRIKEDLANNAANIVAANFNPDAYTEPNATDRAIETLRQAQTSPGDLRFYDTTNLNSNALTRVNQGRANNVLEPLPENFDPYTQLNVNDNLFSRTMEDAKARNSGRIPPNSQWYNRTFGSSYPQQEIQSDYSQYKTPVQQKLETASTNKVSVKDTSEDIANKNAQGVLNFKNMSSESKTNIATQVLLDPTAIDQLVDSRVMNLKAQNAKLTRGSNAPLGKLAEIAAGKKTVSELAADVRNIFGKQGDENSSTEVVMSELNEAIGSIAREADVPREIAQLAVQDYLTSASILDLEDNVGGRVLEQITKIVPAVKEKAKTMAKQYYKSMDSAELKQYLANERAIAEAETHRASLKQARNNYIDMNDKNYSDRDKRRHEYAIQKALDISLSAILK